MSIKKSLAWMGMAQVAVFALQFGSSVVLAHYLSPHEMGVFAVGVATMALLVLLQDLGLQSLIVREEVLTDSIKATAFTINALLSVCLSLATVLLGFLGARFLHDDGVRHVLLVLALSPLAGILAFLPAARMEREGRFKQIAFIITGMNTIVAAVTVALAMLGFSYMSQAYANVLGAAGLATMFLIAGRHHFSCRLGFADWRRVTGFGVQMLAVSGLSNATQRLSEILLGRMLGLASLGLYNRATGMTNLLWSNIHALLSRVVLVDFAAMHRQGRLLRERYMDTAAMITATLWPGFAGLAIIAKPLILIVYGTKWIAAAGPLACVAVASMIYVATTMSWEVFTATGNVRAQTRIEAIRAPIALALFVGGCLISLQAAAASRILDAILVFVLYRPHLNRITGTTLSDFTGIYGQSALLTIAAVTPAALLVWSSRGGAPTVGPLAMAVSGGVALWAAMLFWMKHPLSREVMQSVQHRFAWARA